MSGDLAQPGAPIYKVETINGCPNGGLQTAIATSGTQVAIATLSPSSGSYTCQTNNGSMTVMENYDVCFAESTGGTFSAAKVTTQPYVHPTGVGIAIGPGGEVKIAYSGVGATPAKMLCGANNLFVATRPSGGAFGAGQDVATSSQSTGTAPGMTGCAAQNVCNMGDATGFYPAIAYGPMGAAVAFRDLHYGFATDDLSSSDVEFAQGPGYAIFTVDVSRGGGSYNRIAFDPKGNAAIAHYNGDGNQPGVNGIWVNHVVSGAWTATHVAPAKIGEQLGFGISPGGTWGVAYYDEGNPRLVYVESKDGTTWSPTDVDTDGIVGQFPSLAFDDAGDPAIAYYRCRDYDPQNRSCDQDKDELRLARRKGGQWTIDTVVKTAGVQDGLYPALGFVSGKAVIAYQSIFYDASAMKSMVELDVAREQ